MKKTLLAIAVAATTSFSAFAEDHTPNIDPTAVEVLQALKSNMGMISPEAKNSYIALIAVAQTPEAKKSVAKMMLVNETSTTDIFNAIASHEEGANWLKNEGYGETNSRGKLVPTDSWENGADTGFAEQWREELWQEHVQGFKNELNATLTDLAESDIAAYHKALDVLAGLSIHSGYEDLLHYIGHTPVEGYEPNPTLLPKDIADKYEEELRKHYEEQDLISPPLWESPKDGSTAKKVKEVMGVVSPIDMNGYKTMFALAQTNESKKAVVGMMIVNETSSTDIAKFLATNEDFVAAFPELFEGEDRFGNPEANEELMAIINDKRNAQWNERVGGFYKDIETRVNNLEGQDKQTALNILDSIYISGKSSLLDKMQDNGSLKGEVGEPIPDFQKDVMEAKVRKIVEKYDLAPVENMPIHFAPGQGSDSISFSESVEVICGMEITDNSGSIRFNNEVSSSEDFAKMHAYSNKSGNFNMKFSTDEVSDNLEGSNISIQINGTKVSMDQSHTEFVEFGEQPEFHMIAVADVAKNNIKSGTASIVTTVEYTCGE